MIDKNTRFKIGDRVLIFGGKFPDEQGFIYKIFKCQRSNRWCYAIKISKYFMVYTYRSQITLDQQWHNEREMKKLLGVD